MEIYRRFPNCKRAKLLQLSIQPNEYCLANSPQFNHRNNLMFSSENPIKIQAAFKNNLFVTVHVCNLRIHYYESDHVWWMLRYFISCMINITFWSVLLPLQIVFFVGDEENSMVSAVDFSIGRWRACSSGYKQIS